jgi:hypothetical protein
MRARISCQPTIELMEDNMKVTLMRPATVVVAVGCLRGAALGRMRDDATGDGHRVVLQGSQEVPPVTTSATGSGIITIRPDRSVSGSITTSGINPTAAHIHEAARGVNGPVIVPLVRTDVNVWSVPAGAKLTEAQYAAHRAGNLYVNVHSTTNPGGEIRGQIGGN